MLFASGTMAFQYYAQMWLVYSLTDSAWVLGILGVVRGLATLLFGLYGGALADRMDRRKLLFATQSMAMAVTVALGLLAISDEVALWPVFVLIFIGAATSSLDAPVRQALIPELVPYQHIPNAVALTTAAQMGSFAITPVLAGFVIEALGPGGAYLISAIGNVGILVALVSLHYRGRRSDAASREPLLLTIANGISYARHHGIILWIICLNFVTAAFGGALFTGGLIAKWAGDVLELSPGEYGLLAAVWGVGTLAASYFLSYVGEIRHQGRLLIVGSLIFGLSFALFGFTRSIPLAAFAYLINGAAWTAASIASTAIIQSIVPNEVRGRIMSLFMLNGAVAQMNSLALGGVADAVGMTVMLPAAALLCSLMVAVLALGVPTLRRLDNHLEEARATGRNP